ncbi:receptor protein-tyrosine kinase CEPR2 [Impatiens glandulifera]|uniref:receptor protein-tyrosine kinase CEPR2 n=1 Tax=Impatiens glandulifera TaxID=253017 RepID=UPI001FB0D3F2|nr:receptor protein-tyrosine kinase CEPR2 [Impatiens glandulifera]
MIHLLRHLFLTLLLIISFHGQTSHQQSDPEINSIDLSALRQIRENLNSLPPGPNFFSSWDFTSPDPCSSFAGVTCSYFAGGTGTTKRVTSLTLGTGTGLTGNLSPSISDLDELTQLVLFSGGIVTGQIPPQIGNLKNLRILSLSHNRFTGIIPAAIADLPNLHTLDLSNNILSGPVPSFTDNNQLKVLILSSNRLSGSLPEPLPNQIIHLDLQNNRFTGQLPWSLPVGIRYLSVSKNKLWGPLDNGLIESLSELVYLDLSMNRFSGSIPVSLFKPSISSMLLQRNNFSGWIPTKPVNNNPSSWPILTPPSSYGPGSIVDLSHNALSGELSNVLIGVETLFLNNNRFTGHIPEEYIDSMRRSSTRTLYLQHNYLSGFSSRKDLDLPLSVALCLSYNCMVPPKVGVVACPTSAGEEPSRPTTQCPVFNSNVVG